MAALQGFPDVAVPDKQIDCPDNELVHPRRLKKTLIEYSRLANRTIDDPDRLIDVFYQMSSGYAFAGFKSMPHRHRDFAKFATRGDITFITLVRADIASTVASFMVAIRAQTWRRAGERQSHAWTFRRDDQAVLNNIRYLWREAKLLAGVATPIRLTYEALCDPDHVAPELDAYFGRKVGLPDPSPPTTGRSYVTNWDEFKAFVDHAWADLAARERGRR